MNNMPANDLMGEARELSRLREEFRVQLERGRAELLRKAYALAAAAAEPEAEPTREIDAAVHCLLDDLAPACQPFYRLN
jgi:phosphodiesterase/alkaline phosphatase D-like protein